LGGVAVYADLHRAKELLAVMQMTKADVVINVEPQQYNHAPFSRVDFDGEAYLEQTKALVDAAKAINAKFFVHTSFAWAYGDQGGAVVDETRKPNRSDNPTVKAAINAENAVLKSGVPASVLRLGFVYGSGSAALESLRDTLRRGRFVALDDVEVNWIHELDAAEAVRRTAEAMPAGEIFNVVDDHPASTADFAADFAESFGLQAPGKGMQFLARMGMGDFSQGVAKLPIKASNAKIKESLGWRPSYATQKPGIEQTLLMWRAAEAVES
jgi:nucleoside-diphosphate-sugar epimerase